GILPLWVLAAALAVTWLPETFSTWDKAVRLALCAPLILYFPGRMLVDTLRIEMPDDMQQKPTKKCRPRSSGTPRASPA
ncbi:hypothetical protein ACC764_38500, partial [Rhizobium ruizarguesonis]